MDSLEKVKEGAKGLPNRWCRKHGAIYYRVPPDQVPLWGKHWYRLGVTHQEAVAAYYSALGEIADRDGAGSLAVQEADQIVGRATSVKGPVVYFLFDGKEIVYVGKSRSVLSRVATHTDKHFDSFSTIACKPDEVDLMEVAYIGKFKPKYNVRAAGEGSAEAYFETG